jgi:hypothetical protein
MNDWAEYPLYSVIEFCLVFWFFHKGRGGGGTEGGDYNCYPCVCYDSWLTRERIFVFPLRDDYVIFPTWEWVDPASDVFILVHKNWRNRVYINISDVTYASSLYIANLRWSRRNKSNRKKEKTITRINRSSLATAGEAFETANWRNGLIYIFLSLLLIGLLLRAVLFLLEPTHILYTHKRVRIYRVVFHRGRLPSASAFGRRRVLRNSIQQRRHLYSGAVGAHTIPVDSNGVWISSWDRERRRFSFLSIFPDPIGIFSSSQRFLIDRPPCEPASKLARVSLEFHATQTGGGLMSRSPLISSANPPPQ